MASKKDNGGVRIGSIGGSIEKSIIAGGDVSNVTISVGGHEKSAQDEPTVDELKQLLVEIRQEMAEVLAQQEALSEVSTFAPNNIQQIEGVVSNVAQQVESSKEPPQAPEKIEKNLKDATNLLSNVLDSAKTVAEKGGEVAETVKPLAEKLGPLVDKLGFAALWAAKLWLVG